MTGTWGKLLRACLTLSQGSPPDLVHEVCLNDALAVLRDRNFDVVLLDLHLPDSSGKACVRAIKQVNPNLPIVVLSGDDSEEYAIGILNERVQDYLVKWDGEGKGIRRAFEYQDLVDALVSDVARRLRMNVEFELRPTFAQIFAALHHGATD